MVATTDSAKTAPGIEQANETPIAESLILLLGRLARARSFSAMQPRVVVGLAIAGFVLVPLFGGALPRLLAVGLFGLSLLVLCAVVATAIHELGHFAGAWATEMRVDLVAVVPLAVAARGDRWKLRRWDSWQVPGLVLAGPRDSDDLRRRLMMAMLGGPLASFVSGGFFLLLSSGFESHPWVVFTFSVLALISLLIGATSLWPRPVQGLMTDGGVVISLLRRDPQGIRLLATERLYAAAWNGQRPRHWSEAVVAEAVSAPDGSYADACGRYFSYLAAVDEGDTERAAEDVRALIVALQAVPPALADDMAAEAAFFVLANEELSAEQRAAMTTLVPRACGGCEALPRLRALMLLDAGDANAARDLAQSALRDQEWRGEHGIARLEREWLAELIAVAG
jgi:hypothetical protein